MYSSSPGVVLADAGSVGASLIVWVVCGLLAWTGARSVVLPSFESGNEALRRNLQLIRRAGFCDTFDWRRTGIPRLCISPNRILFVRLDRYINIKTRRKCYYCVDIWVRAVMECNSS